MKRGLPLVITDFSSDGLDNLANPAFWNAYVGSRTVNVQTELPNEDGEVVFNVRDSFAIIHRVIPRMIEIPEPWRK